jgi:Zn finger protein HypA/HybF involved in hydrogenase expression
MTSTYNDLVNVASFGKKRENFDFERGALVHYCHDCAGIVEVEVVNEDLGKYRCSVCGSERIASGSEASIREHFIKRR